MKPSVPLHYATARHTSIPLLCSNATTQQLRRATVLHNLVRPLSPHQIRNLRQVPPLPPAPSPEYTPPPPQQKQDPLTRKPAATFVIDRYRDKLARKARENGISEDMDALRDAYKDRIDAMRRRDAVVLIPPAPTPVVPVSASNTSPVSSSSPLSTSSSTSTSTPPSSPATPTPSAEETAPPPPAARQAIKPLSALLDLEKIRPLPNTELSAIWRLRHAGSETSLCAIIPARTYRVMERLARRASPQFVLPVPHEREGAELHFLQWTFGSGDGSHTGAPATTSTVLFTSLAEYKLRGEFAQPHTTVTHHLDLADERGLVLMEGRVVEGHSATTVDQARWLVMCLQRFYGALPDTETGTSGEPEPEPVALGRRNRRQLVEWFGKGDSRFTIDMLMEEAQRVG